MNSISLSSPAKLNLFLEVVNKRPDGYHNLITLFERIDLCDDITLSNTLDGAIQVFCDHADVPTDSKNLVYKAAQMLRDDFALSNGVNIRIKKRIPVAAGLGGGSGNAATVLLGLNRLWKLQLSLKELLSYGQAIGSDVPFFLQDCSWAVGTQRGDKIKRLTIGTQLWHILIVPSIKMYSRDVFEALNLKLTKKVDDVNILTRSLKKNDLFVIGSLLRNDLESAILKLVPSLHSYKEMLQKCGLKCISFSGSGPAIFGLVESQAQAEELKIILQNQNSQVFVVKTY